MLEIDKISSKYNVYRLDESDIDEIFDLCKKNKLFYKYCEANISKDQIKQDLNITPEGFDIKNKYYLGFYDKEKLIAVMDLLDGYPDSESVFIGFFMMNIDYQGKQIGSFIIEELVEYLRKINIKQIHLGIDKDNPQSNNFWKKNGFRIIKQIKRNNHTISYVQRTID